jgi:hypothetical protein
MRNIVLLLTMMIAAAAVLSASALISYNNVTQQAIALKAVRYCYKSTQTGLTCFAELSKCESARLADKTSISDRCFVQR